VVSMRRRRRGREAVQDSVEEAVVATTWRRGGAGGGGGRRGKGRARRVCNRSEGTKGCVPVWDQTVSALGRGSAGQNGEGAEPRGGALPLRVFRGRDLERHGDARIRHLLACGCFCMHAM
jgi:hypothetical protein